MNPFDLQGPQFLGFWLAGWVVVAAAMFAVRGRVRRARTRESADELAAKLHPTEIAFLLGGIDRAIEAAVAGLHHRGYVALDGDRLRRLVDRDSALRSGRGDRADVSRMERYVLDHLPATLADLRAGARPIALVVQRRLEELGLLVEDHARATRVVRLPAYAWMLVGAAKVALGFARGQPVFLLFVLMFGGVFAIMAVTAPRLTALGRAVERTLKARYAALEATARAAPQQLDASDMALAYGVFGWTVAPLALIPILPNHHAAATSTSSCGSVAGDCSSGDGCGGCGGCSS